MEAPVRKWLNEEVAPSSIVASASAGELGELFEYRVAQPVTIRKDESAMLPFLQQPIEARKLLIYSDHSSQHPTNAAELTNSSGKTLDGGPITVYDGGAYAGEALMETLKAADKRLISYAVDIGHPHHRGLWKQTGGGPRASRCAWRFDHQTGRGRDPDLYRPQRGQEGQDADYRAPAAAGLHLAQPEADGEDGQRLPFEIQLAPGDTQEFSRFRRARVRPDLPGDQPDTGYNPEFTSATGPSATRAEGSCSASRTRSGSLPTTTGRCKMPRGRCATSTPTNSASGRTIGTLNNVSGQQAAGTGLRAATRRARAAACGFARPPVGVAEEEIGARSRVE